MAYEIWATDCAGKAAYPSLCRYEKLQAQKRQRVRITVEMTKALWYNQKTENMNGAIIMDDLTYTTSMIQEIKELSNLPDTVWQIELVTLLWTSFDFGYR